MRELALNVLDITENSLSAGAKLIRITLDIRFAEDAFSICIEDDGCGMEPAILDRLFEQSIPHDDRERSDSRRSLGIGLSVCNTIIRAHGGRMTAYNRPKGGAAVEFTLPLEDETV